MPLEPTKVGLLFMDFYAEVSNLRSAAMDTEIQVQSREVLSNTKTSRNHYAPLGLSRCIFHRWWRLISTFMTILTIISVWFALVCGDGCEWNISPFWYTAGGALRRPSRNIWYIVRFEPLIGLLQTRIYITQQSLRPDPVRRRFSSLRQITISGPRK